MTLATRGAPAPLRCARGVGALTRGSSEWPGFRASDETDRDDFGRPNRSYVDARRKVARQRRTRPRTADRSWRFADREPRAPPHIAALARRRRARRPLRSGADRFGALSRPRSAIDIRRSAGIRRRHAPRRRAIRGRQSRQRRSTGSPDRHRRGQADLQGADHHQDRRQRGRQDAAVHDRLDRLDDDADGFCGRRPAIRPAQGDERFGRKGRCAARSRPGAGRCGSRIFPARPDRRGRRGGDGRTDARRGAGASRGNDQGDGRRRQGAAAAPANAVDAHEPGGRRSARRPVLRGDRRRGRRRAFRFDRSAHGAGKRHRRRQGPRRRPAQRPRTPGADASRRNVRGRAARQRREQGRRRGDSRRFRRQARRIARRRGTEDHLAVRRAARRGQAGADRARFGLRGRAAQVDDRDQRRRRLRASDAAPRRPPRAEAPIRTRRTTAA